MIGIHKRVGEVRRQDGAFTIEIIQEIKKLLEMEWTRLAAEDLVERKRVAEMGVWFIVGFCCGLRGEEMMLIELTGILGTVRKIWLKVKDTSS